MIVMIQRTNQTRRSKVPFIPEEQINFDFKYDRILFDQESGKFLFQTDFSSLQTQLIVYKGIG